MKLRLKLFVYIGCVFVLISCMSYILQDFITGSNLRKAEADMKRNVVNINIQKRAKLEVLLAENLDDYKSWINAMLLRIKNYPPLRELFSPSSKGFKEDHWLDCATILIENKSFDFIETDFKNGQNSVTIIDDTLLPMVQVVSLTDALKVVLPPKESAFITPLVAVPMKLSEVLANKPPIDNPREDLYADFYILFSVDAILLNDWNVENFSVLNLIINPLEPFLRWEEIKETNDTFAAFVESINLAKKEIQNNPKLVSEEYLVGKYANSSWTPQSFDGKDKDMYRYLARYNTIGMTWGLATLISSGPFNGSPFSPNAPIGVVKTPKGKSDGIALLANKVFKNSFFTTNLPPVHEGFNFTNTLKIIIPKTVDDFYFGNTLQLAGTDHDFSIAMGINGRELMMWTSFALQKLTILCVDDKVLDIYDKEGTPILKYEFDSAKIPEMMQNAVGEVSLNNQKYFYVKLKPYPEESFTFFTLTPYEEEFYLVQSLDKNARLLIKKISAQMAVIALIGMAILLFLLDRIARKISLPITSLASATKVILRGKLDEVPLPKVEKNPKDEVSVLTSAFADMVQGLKEKERVRGVLNKVVSSEIADEILKNDVHLGGEEREVTVFFADIRGFTKITEKMPPKEVIEFLNTCMTRVSKIIDSHGGVIDKYVGDEVMALFGAPLDKPKSVLNAITCGLDIVQSLKEWNDVREKEGKPRVEMGIGIHRGLMVIGNMGAENRLNYTVMGANVNLGSRICQIAKPNEILITERVYQGEYVRESVQVEDVEPVSLKGFSENIKIFKVKGVK